MPVLIELSDEKGFPHKCKVESADSRLDPKTGTARWRALLPNPDGVLMPGMSARVRLVTSDSQIALLVPESAFLPEVGNYPGHKGIWIVTDQNVVQRRDVGIGQLNDDGMRVVKKGLTADDWVIEKGIEAFQGRFLQEQTVKPLKTPAAVRPSSSQDYLPAAAPAAELKGAPKTKGGGQSAEK